MKEYFYFFVTGVLAFITCLLIYKQTSILTFMDWFLFPLLVWLIFTVIASTILYRIKKSETLVMIGSLVSFFALILSFIIVFVFAAWSAYEDKTIRVYRVDPPNAYNAERLKGIPLKNIGREKFVVNMSLDEFFELKNELKYRKMGINCYRNIKIGENYYKVFFYDAVGVQKLKCQNCVEVNDKLKPYPFVKGLLNYEETKEKYNRKVIARDFEMYDEIKYEIEEIGDDIIIFKDGVVITNVTEEQLYQTDKFVNEIGNKIKFGENCYYLFVDTQLLLDRIKYPPKCLKITEVELNRYPTLERALDIAIEKGRASLKTSPEEWRKTFDFMQNMASNCIEFNGSYYEIRFATV